MTEQGGDRRGAGNVANAMRRRVARGGPPREAAPAPQPRATRSRRKPGKRSNDNYVLAGAYVRRQVSDRVKQALVDDEVKRALLIELDELGVEHQPRKPGYSDLVEMLLMEWLERMDRPAGS